MEPHEFVEEGLWVQVKDYRVREDGEICAILSFDTPDKSGELELTKKEIRAAIRYINEEDVRTRSACLYLGQAADLITRAEKQPEPGKGDLTLKKKFNEVTEAGQLSAPTGAT